jgi:hypothetical protein
MNLDEQLRAFSTSHRLADLTTTQFISAFDLFVVKEKLTISDLRSWAENFEEFLMDNRTFEPGLELRLVLLHILKR